MGVTLSNFIVPRRGRTSSNDFNTHLEDIQHDLLEAYQRQTIGNKRLLQFISGVNFQNQAITAHISEVQSTLSDTEAHFSVNNATKLISVNMWKSDAVTSAFNLRHDIVHGQLTLNITNSRSHIPVIRDSKGQLRPSSAVEAFRQTVTSLAELSSILVTGVTTPVSRPNDLYKAINKSPLDLYINPYEPSEVESTGFFYEVIQFELPTSITPAVNSFVIHPFPYFTSDIFRVTLKQADGTFTLVPGFDSSTGITSANNTHFHFSSFDYANAFQVWMKPTTRLTDDKLTEKYVVGYQNIDLGFLEYASQGSAVIKMRASDASISNLRSFDADFTLSSSNSAPTSDYIWFEIYQEQELINKVYDSRTNVFPMTEDDVAINVTSAGSPIEELWVRVGMAKLFSTTPVLTNLKMTYT